MHVNDLLKIAVETGASDLHLKAGSYPMMRLRGALVPASAEKKLDHEDVVAMSAAVTASVMASRVCCLPDASKQRSLGTLIRVPKGSRA